MHSCQLTCACIPLLPFPSTHRRLMAQLAVEEERRRCWADENIRRRTDYIPFAFQLLTALAEKGQLQPLVEAAQQAHTAKVAERQAQRQGGAS